MNKLSNKKIQEIKNFLIQYYEVNTWEECVDLMCYGDCKKICKLIVQNFPNTFNNYFLDVACEFSEEAQKLIGDDLPMYGNHYLLKCGKYICDFARGCNCINGIYVLTQNNNLDKYDIEFTDKENALVVMSVKHQS